MADELKGLIESIETNSKALVLGVAAVACFLVAPKAHDNLRAAKLELDAAVTSTTPWATAENAKKVTDQAVRLDDTKSRLQQQLQQFQDNKAFTVADGAASTLSTEEIAALGYGERTKLGEIVALFGEGGHRCAAHASDPERTLAALSALFTAPTLTARAPIRVDRIELRAVTSPQAVAAVSSYLEALSTVGRRATKTAPASEGAPTAPSVLPPYPEPILVMRGESMVRVPNPKLAEWEALRDAIAQKSNVAKVESARKEYDRKAFDEAVNALVGKDTLLADAVASQPPSEGARPSYVLAYLSTGANSLIGAPRLLLPLVCGDAPVLGANVGKASGAALPAGTPLPHLRIAQEWDRLKDLTPPQASKILDEVLLAEEESLDLFGLQVPERQLYETVPFLLAAGLVWHILFLNRLRRLAKDPEWEPAARNAIDLTPALPARRNLPMALTVCFSMLAIAAAIGLSGKSPLMPWTSGLVVILSLCSLALSFGINPSAPRKPEKNHAAAAVPAQ